MIPNALFIILAAFLRIISFVLGLITVAFPTWVTTATELWFSYIGYAQGVLPMYADASMSGLNNTVGIMNIFGWELVLLGAYFTFEMIHRIINYARFKTSKH